MARDPLVPPDAEPWPPRVAAFDRIRNHDWARTALGPLEGWPASLRTAVGVVMQSAVPGVMHWGDGLVRLYNDAFAAVARRPNPAFGEPLAADGMPAASLVERVRGGEALEDERTALPEDGGDGRVFAASHSPLRDETGTIRGVMTFLTESVSDATRRTVQHRLRNALATVRSVARRTAETSADVANYAEHFDGRLDALARGQMLASGPGGAVLLEELVTEELLAQSAQLGEGVRVEGPPVWLAPEAAGTFGLAVHELAVNAVEHGAFDEPGASIAATWTVTEAGDVRFDWVEAGAPAPGEGKAESAFERFGFGREVIERKLPYELDAATELVRTGDGVRCRVALPARHVTVGEETALAQHAPA